jgi:hypothetical protein
MTAITPMIRPRGDGIPGMTEKGRSEQQSMMGESLHLRRHSIDRAPSPEAFRPSIFPRRAAADEAH